MNDSSISQDSNEAQPGDEKPFLAYVRPILFLALIFGFNFLSRIILAPLMPTIENDLGIRHGEAGTLFFLISAGYFVILLSSGFFSWKLAHRTNITLSSTALGLALLGVSVSSGLWGIRIGLLLLGMAGGIYLPSGIATLTSLMPSRHWGKAIAIHELAPNVSFVAAPLIAELLLGWFSWRGVLASLGITSFLIGMLYLKVGKGGEFHGEAPSMMNFKSLLAQPAFWIITVLFSLGISSSFGIYTMLPLFLVVGHSMSQTQANILVGLSRLPGIGLAFVSGWATDRFGPKSTLATVFFLTAIMTVLVGIASSPWLIALVIIQPMLAVGFFPAGFAALSSLGSAKIRNMAVSLVVPFAFLLGGGAVPLGIGMIGDVWSFGTSFVVIGGLIFGGFILSCNLKTKA